MANNYNSSNVGVPYIRANRIVFEYPADDLPGVPQVTMQIEQTEGVKMADGSRRTLKQLPTITSKLDQAQQWTEQIPLVDPTTGAPTGQYVTRQQVMLSVLAVVRAAQPA